MLATTHGHRDGNKRIAFVATYTFLRVNGWDLDVPEPAAVQIMLDAAQSICDEAQLAAWLRAHSRPWLDQRSESRCSATLTAAWCTETSVTR